MSTFKVRMKRLHVLAVLLSIIGLCSAGNRPLDKPKNIPSTSRNVSLNSNNRRINCRQKCAIGYYRDWNGFFSGRCVPCRCHGHSKQCADRSGRCIDCKHNTEGDHCERCKSGFFGNAAQGTCSSCPCPYTQPSNSFATRCGEINGAFQCMCKPGYTGSRCERCAPGYFGNPLEIGSECRPCQCGHSSSTSCDPLTGQCSNCQDCTNEEPKDTSSDEKCDTCDSCVEALLLDLNKMDSDLHKIKLQLQNANTSTATQHRMNNLDKSIKNTENQLKVYQATVERHVKRTDDLENDNMNLVQDVLALEEKVEKDSRTTQLLLSSINVTHQRAQDMVTNIENVLLQILEMLKTMNTLDSSSGTAPKLDEVERMLNEMRNRNFDEERRVADRENQESKILLDRIKNGFVKNIEENKQLASNIMDALSLYQTKLMDLQDAITEAANLTQKAENLNGINSISLDNIKNKHGKLNIKQAEVASLLQMADVTLNNLNNMLRMLDKSQEDYEKHGAQLDGALSSLEDKIKKLSNANSKEPIVVSAERHAENLDQLSKQLHRAIEEVNQDSLIQRVVDASDAYEKIINAVDAAEMAANKAANASHIALQAVVKEDLPGQASELKTKSDDIFSTTNGLNRNFKDVSSKLRDASNRLNNAKSKKNELQPGLAPLQAKLQQINRDDVGETLDMAKDAAKEANDTANRVMSKLQPIINDIKNLNRSSESIENATAINIALREAENSVKNLTNTLPDLVKKLKDLSQIQPVNNISKNIGRIRELIDQAREAANKINVAMKFNGNSGVEVRLPDNLDHLKPYTSLLLYLKRPNVLPPRGDAGRRKRQDATNMFVLYLGNKDTSKDYMGMALQGEKLVTVYKLANDEAKIISEKTVNKESFDIVKFERILQYGSLNYSQVSSTMQKRIDSVSSNVTAKGDDLLLNLDPKNTVFYVGGFPPTFVPPAALDYPKYKGCIELGVLNEKLISLYNFEQTFNINTTEDRPCQRYKPRGNEGFYFDGTGYALIKLSGYAQNLAIEQTIQTLSKNAVLLYLESKDSSCVLTIEDGRLVFRYDLKSSAPKVSQSSVPLNTSNEIVIRIRMLNSKKRTVVIVNGVNAVYVNNTFSQLDFRNYYLGGIPSQIKERLNIPVKTSVRACMKNLKAEERNIDLSNEPIVGVSKGCSKSLLLVRTAYFNGSGLLGLPASDLTFPENFHIGFGFATSQLNSLLFSYEKNNFDVFLENGKVVVNILGKVLKSQSSFNDGANHYVSIQRIGNRIYLNVDDMDKQKETIQLGQPGTEGLVYLGGDKNRRNFDGCISNVFLQRNRESPRIENLAFSVEDTGVYLDTCPQQRAPEMLMLKEGRKWNGQETVKTNKNGKNQKVIPDYSTKENTGQESKDCLLPWQPKSVSGAYQFGDSPDSRLEYDFVPESFKERSTFSIDVRTVATEGTIFYVADKSGKSSMILYVSRGRFIFSFTVNEKKLKIKSKAKHNDGKWHTVVFSRENNKGKLIIDGLRTRHASFSDSALLKVESPFYLGGLPSGKKRRNRKLHGFQGCLRNFKMDGSELHSPLHTFGVTPCFDGKFKQGVYFSAKGGYVVLDNSFVVGKDFELLFAVRPQSQTGILFHINSSQGNYLSLYMYKGKVTVHVNNGAGDFNTSVTPQSLCDGQWHRIVVIKRNNVVQLDVDTERDHVVGPAASLSTDTADPLYVGGIPDNVQLSHLPTRNPFIGCMGEVVINVKPVSFKKAVAVHGAVSVTRCPVM